MTVKEVIETVDALRPNEIAAEDKRKWLYELESRIYEDLYVTHEHEGIEFTDTENITSDGTTELFIKAPHDEIYILYLCHKGSANTGVLLCHGNGSDVFDFKCDKIVARFGCNNLFQYRLELFRCIGHLSEQKIHISGNTAIEIREGIKEQSTL